LAMNQARNGARLLELQPRPILLFEPGRRLSSHSAHQRPGIFQSQTSHIHEDRLNETVMAPVYSNHRQPFAHSIFAHRGAFKGQ